MLRASLGEINYFSVAAVVVRRSIYLDGLHLWGVIYQIDCARVSENVNITRVCIVFPCVRVCL